MASETPTPTRILESPSIIHVEIDRRLKEDGLSTDCSHEKKLLYIWRLFQNAEVDLYAAFKQEEKLKVSQAEEMQEVENYVERIRHLSDEREALIQELETENDQLKQDIERYRQEQNESTPTMSEPDTSDPIESPRKESDAHSSLRGAVPKAKRRGYGTSTKKRAAKSPSRFRDPLPFFEPDPSDPYSDITIVVNDKRLYFNKCLLSWHSKVLKEQLADDAGANKGRGQPAKTVANKELKMEHKFDDVVELLAYMDPRLECNLTDQAAMRLAAFAQQYDMIRLRKDCEETLTSSYANMRKNKKTGMMPTETILAYLKPADEFKYEKLLNMCIDDAVDNVFVDGKIERMEDDLSYPVQKEILRRKNIKLRQQLSKKTRELEMSETERNERRAEFHPIWRR